MKDKDHAIHKPPIAPTLPENWAERLKKCHEAITTSKMRLHTFRLRPKNDLLESLRTYVKQQRIQAAVLLSAVGSLTQAALRYANQSETHIHQGNFEIVSITGTIEENGEHVHLSIATNRGKVIGGHLQSGCKIYTTAEIMLGELMHIRFEREIDKEGSGWKELKIYQIKK